jgi:hypothetical protein
VIQVGVQAPFDWRRLEIRRHALKVRAGDSPGLRPVLRGPRARYLPTMGYHHESLPGVLRYVLRYLGSQPKLRPRTGIPIVIPDSML